MFAFPPPYHPRIRRVEFHQVRAKVAALRSLGYTEQSRLMAPNHLAELFRARDGSSITVALGTGGSVLLIADRPWRLL